MPTFALNDHVTACRTENAHSLAWCHGLPEALAGVLKTETAHADAITSALQIMLMISHFGAWV